jgi:hypothetical protein
MGKGSWRPPAAIPKVDDDSRFAIHVPHRQSPRRRPAVVAGEIRRFGEGPDETIGYAEASVGADELTKSIPVLPIESLHV